MPYSDPAKQREFNRKWIAARRSAWMSGKCCVDCGGTERLQVDHVDRTKKVEHRVWSWAIPRRDAELRKCVVRCVPCHVRKGQQVGDTPVTSHGTSQMYHRHGCRCDVCREWKAWVNATYRASKGQV